MGSPSSLVSHSIFMVTFLSSVTELRLVLLLHHKPWKSGTGNNLPASSITTQSLGTRFPRAELFHNFLGHFLTQICVMTPQPTSKAWLYLLPSSGLPLLLSSFLPTLLPSTNHSPRASHVTGHNLLNLENKKFTTFNFKVRGTHFQEGS